MSLTAKEAFSKLPQKLHNFFIKYPPRPFKSYSDKPTTIDAPDFNPFMAAKNPETGRWRGSQYSLRRASDLYKMARKFGIQDLLPPIPKKFYEEKYNDKVFMKGVLNPKGRKWEHALPEKLVAREEAIANMDDIILKARPGYKKLLEKRKLRQKKFV